MVDVKNDDDVVAAVWRSRKWNDGKAKCSDKNIQWRMASTSSSNQ